MVGTTWELKDLADPKGYTFIMTVVRLNDKRDAWACVVLLDTGTVAAHQPGQVVEFEEPDIVRFFRRIG